MKRRSEHLVRKRDGRTEFLRTTKLARSIHQALKSVGVDEDWRALEVSAAVLAGLRERDAGASPGCGSGATAAPAASLGPPIGLPLGPPLGPPIGPPLGPPLDIGSASNSSASNSSKPNQALTTELIGAAVESVLIAIGQPAAAVAFGEVASVRSRRRSSLLMLGRQAANEVANHGGGASGADQDTARGAGHGGHQGCKFDGDDTYRSNPRPGARRLPEE